MVDVIRLLGIGWIVAAGVMVLLWLIQRRTGNAGVVDVGWAGTTGALAVLYGIIGEGEFLRRILLAALGGAWGWRLAWHLWRDRVWNQPEEGRYVTLRENWSPHADRSFFIFYQAQALAAVALSAPFALAALATAKFPSVTDLAAVLVVVIGVAGETLADQQLGAFKKDPASRGRTCRSGLWRYSRHPNYFFEWILWCGFGLLGLAGPWGWVGLAAPALMLYTILFVTGIPPTEAQAVSSRGEDYRAYQRTTSPFVPWPPRRDAGPEPGDS
jgi:steroid 5-alpha reductase family enzyme